MRGLFAFTLLLCITLSFAPQAEAKAKHSKTYHSKKMTAKKSQRGLASWYGPHHHGKKTASGERFNMNAFTAAHKTLPINSLVKVKNLSTGKTVTVRINDRGPYAKGRIIDVSKAAAKKLGFMDKGTARVEITVISQPRKLASH